MALTDLALALLADGDTSAQNRVIEALRRRGAVSPAAARPFDDFNVASDDTWRRLVIEGRVREGPPGQFYLYERPRPGKRQMIIKMVVFYGLIILIPIVLILLNGKGR